MVFLTKRKILTQFQINYTKHFLEDKTCLVFADLSLSSKSAAKDLIKLNKATLRDLSRTKAYGLLLKDLARVNLGVYSGDSLHVPKDLSLPILQLFNNKPERDVMSSTTVEEVLMELGQLASQLDSVLTEILSFINALDRFDKKS